MGTIIADQWLHNTVIVHSKTSQGTGFLVSRPSKRDPDLLVSALVTNKHVLGPSYESRKQQQIALELNLQRPDGSIVGHELSYKYYAETYREHPDQYVDVAIIAIANVIHGLPDWNYKLASINSFATRDVVMQMSISPGDDILTLGYPLGFKQGATNFPVVRQGVLATSLLDDLSGEAARLPVARPAFLIDGGFVHGASGSPVVLKPVAGRIVDGNLELGTTRAVLLGILAETRLGELKGQPAYIGLGMAFRVETIIETLDLFDE